jgi:RNA polymerase sigma-70 factor (ECF subfamily)
VSEKDKSLEKEILIRAQSGDLEAFEQILFYYEKPIFNYCRRVAGNTQDAQDITQETFIKVYNHRRSIDPEKNIKTWIFTIATNTAYDLLRSRKRKNETSLCDEDSETIANPGSYYSREGIGLDIEQALGNINPEYKRAILLAYVDGFEYKEIADILALPINTVKTHISRGKEQLKKVLKEYGNN